MQARMAARRNDPSTPNTLKAPPAATAEDAFSTGGEGVMVPSEARPLVGRPPGPMSINSDEAAAERVFEATGRLYPDAVRSASTRSDEVVVAAKPADGPPLRLNPKPEVEAAVESEQADLVEAAPPVTEAPEQAPEQAAPRTYDKVWAINALSSQDEDRVNDLLAALRAEGLHVYSYPAQVKGQTWLRVRVGFFESRAKAETVGRRVAKKHELPEPWIVMPGPSELDKYYEE
jgi:cell division septation protein DedD